MKDKLKIFEYLDTLVRMCRSKSDGASLKEEENDIIKKIEEIDSEIGDINDSLREDIYDESSEMADRNLEIITRRIINTLKIELKEKEEELQKLQEKEKEVVNELTIFKDNRSSYENYINVLQERINNCNDEEVINSYQSNIRVNEDRLKEENEKASLIDLLEEKIIASINSTTSDIETINSKITKKQDLLDEIRKNLQEKDTYIDIDKKRKIDRRINELEKTKTNLNNRLKEIKKDPKYIEIKIKEIINDGADSFLARGYIIDLVNMANKVPYMNMPIDNNLETELLKATKERDTFANEIDHKSYSLVDLENPTKIRIDYLNQRINIWKEKQNSIKKEISMIDNDELYNYKRTKKILNNIIDDIKLDISELTTTLENDNNYIQSLKSNLKATLSEKKKDLETAEYIAEKFRKEESEEILRITTSLQSEYNEVEEKIINANSEIEQLNNELLSKRTDLTDVRAINKDKERLRDLANVVIDIKHRRNFPLQPTLIAKQLERMLGIEILSSLDQNTSTPTKPTEENKDGNVFINELIKKDIEEIEEQYPEEVNVNNIIPDDGKRGLKVTSETEITDKASDKEIEEHHDRIGYIESEPLNYLNNIEEELNKKISSLQQEEIDNTEQKYDNRETTRNEIDELERYINDLEEN